MGELITLQAAGPKATGFYTSLEAARLARVPRRRLDDWKVQGVIMPDVEVRDEDGEVENGYSFDALVYLHLLRTMREQEISLAKAVMALQHLRDRFGPPGPNWSDARLFVYGGEVWADRRDDWETTAATRAGQKAARVLMGREFAELRQRADAILIPRRFLSSVEINPRVRSGRPIVRGTTIETAVIVSMFRAERTYRGVQEHYSRLTPAQIRTAVSFEKFLDSYAA